MKKITKTTFKSFIKKNADRLFIQVKSSFDGMTDCVQQVKMEFKKLEKNEKYHTENNLGYSGIWLVGSSRDYFRAYEDDNFMGFYCYNCCGSFTVAIKK